MQVLEKLKINLKSQKKDIKFQTLILNVGNNLKSFSCEILGRRFVDWIAFACGNMSVKLIDYNKTEPILTLAKNQIDKSYDYTIILLSSTPLIESAVVENIVEYCSTKRVSLCKLPVGYVVNNNYITESSSCDVDSVYSQNLESFYIVENKKQYNYAVAVLLERVNSFHIANGVDIKKIQSTYIEPEVDIAKGVIIYPNNSLKGNTKIGKDTILKENNVIQNSSIGDNCCICGSNIEQSYISSSVYVSAFSDIKNCIIGNDSTIGSGCKIYNQNLKAFAKVKANEVLGEDNDSNSGTR